MFLYFQEDFSHFFLNEDHFTMHHLVLAFGSAFRTQIFSFSFLKNNNTSYTLTLCGTPFARKLQFFYSEILPEFKNRPMPKTVNAICKQIIKVKKSYKISGMNFSSWEFSVCVFSPDTLCRKGIQGVFEFVGQTLRGNRAHCMDSELHRNPSFQMSS